MSVRSTYPLAGQRIRIEPTAVIQSPAFQTNYPSVRNLEIVPEGVRHAMEESWKRGLFEPRDIEIFCIPGACVSEECLIFDTQLRVIENASDKYTDEEIEAALGSIFKLLDAEKLPHLAGRGIVAKRRAANNFGHFLLEMIPMAVGGAAVPGDKEPRFLLHRVEPPMLDVMLRALRLLGITPNRLLFPDVLEPMRFEELVIVRGLSVHGTYISPHCVDAVGRLAAQIRPSGSGKRLFVRRRPGWRRGRSLVNEAELEIRLAAIGFQGIEPSVLSLEEQIAEFSSADEVIGVSGAAMTNIVFCRPGTRVVNLVSAHFPDTFFWFIASHRGLNYSEIRGDTVSGEVFDPLSDFRIRESDIAWLESQHGHSEDRAYTAVQAHLHDVGDVQGTDNEWIGSPGSRHWIEGFSIGTSLGHIHYRAVLGRNWLSPWITDNSFCGTRGVGLPLHGLEVRLAGDLLNQFDCRISATFVDGTRRDDVPAEQPCMADSLAPLEAFQIVLNPR